MAEFGKKDVTSLIASIESGKVLGLSESREALRLLAVFECWSVYNELLGCLLDKGNSFTKKDFVHHLSISVQNDDWSMSWKLARSFVAASHVTFQDYKESIVDQDWIKFDYSSQAKLFDFVVELFSNRKERIFCLEYLAVIYEKKLPDEAELTKVVGRLIDLDPLNIVALRHLKGVHWYNNDFEKVLDCLKKLLRAEKTKSQQFRLGVEMASLLLYQLANPSACLGALDEYCQGDHLDITTLRFEALVQANELQKAREILIGLLVTTNEPLDFAVLYFKMGCLSKKLGSWNEAYNHFHRCLEYHPKFLEAYEHVIDLHLERSEWAEVRRYLIALSEQMADEPFAEQLNSLVTMIDSGVRSAG